jgi:hypothetical protein
VLRKFFFSPFTSVEKNRRKGTVTTTARKKEKDDDTPGRSVIVSQKKVKTVKERTNHEDYQLFPSFKQ